MPTQNFTDLIAWQKSHSLVLYVYKITELFPKSEQYSLSNQMRRAAVSVTSNIAEGYSRVSKKEKRLFYSTSAGSISELQSQPMIARDLRYITSTDYQKAFNLSVEAHKLLNSLIKKLTLANN